MPDQDDVSMDKVSFTDLKEDYSGSDFGIKDTQLLANNDLQSFLLSDPDEVKNLEEEKKKEEAKQKAEAEKSKTTPPAKEDKTKIPPAKQETTTDGKDALDDILFGKPKEDVVNTTGAEEAKEDGDDTYTTLGKDLMRLGVFSKNSEDESEETLEFKTPQEFLDRFNLEKKKGAVNILDNFLTQFGEDYRKMFDAVFVNGVKPQEYLQSFAKIEAIANIDLATEDNQERVVKAYYKNLKWDDAKIETKIQKLKDYGDLEDEAKAYHEVLLNKEKEAVTALEQKKQQEAQVEKEKEISAKKSYLRILTEKLKTQDFDGLPVTEKDVQETVDYLSEKKYKLASGELLSEYDKTILELNRPENHELKVKLGLLLRKKLDLTSVKKATISKKSDALFTLSTKNAKQNPKEQEIKSFF